MTYSKVLSKPNHNDCHYIGVGRFRVLGGGGGGGGQGLEFGGGGEMGGQIPSRRMTS